jgi:hypothetical protein
VSIPPSYQQERHRGRPKLFKHVATVYMDDEMDAAIRGWAARSKVPFATALREVLQFGLDSLEGH